jgi:anaerobic magnesium-protoporphyrin IX monomethyl ester cyclase
LLDILFVHPNASKKIYQDLHKQDAAIEPPIWAGLLANSVKSIGKGVAILDAEADQLSDKEIALKVQDFKPRIVCLVVYGQQPSASSQNMSGAVSAANEIKKIDPETFVLFVGGHVAALPRETLKNEPNIDAVCTNEGVYTIRTLVSNKNFKSHLDKINGLAFRDVDNNIVVNDYNNPVEKRDLDHILPGIAWDLLPSLTKYRTAGWHSWSNNSEKQPFAALYTSLGCPYKCSFCMINIINRTLPGDQITSSDSNKFRTWSPDFIIKQFDFFAENNIVNIKIADELFVLNPNHFIKICDLIIERGYNFNIWAYSRVDTCKPQYLSKLKKAGVNWLGLGIENPSESHRIEIHKSGYQSINIVDQIDLIRNEGINVGGNYIFGLPNETHGSMKNTLEFAKQNPTEMVNFYCAMAYPGSPLYNVAKQKGIELPTKYEGYSQHSYETLNLRNDNLNASEILKFRDNAWLEYHTHQPYKKLLFDKFGIKAVKQLESTTKIKLKRRLVDG